MFKRPDHSLRRLHGDDIVKISVMNPFYNVSACQLLPADRHSPLRHMLDMTRSEMVASSTDRHESSKPPRRV